LDSDSGHECNTFSSSDGGAHGDLQGIAGRSLLEIEGLEMPLLDAPASAMRTSSAAVVEKIGGS
jgi:hypothetical protein